MEISKKFGKTLLTGSETVAFLDKKVIERLKWFIDDESEFLVGDNIGADLAWQNYLNSIGYRHVTIYYLGNSPHFNLGMWEIKQISDEEKTIDAECGFFLWDAKSRKTRFDICEMKRKGKPVMVYRIDTDELKIVSRRIKKEDST